MEKNYRKTVLILFTLVLLTSVGCRQHTIKPHLKSKFENHIDQLVLDTVASCKTRLAEIAPATVISGNALNGGNYTGLDELIIQRLKDRLASDREIIELSRENWFELRESKPLSFKGHSGSHGSLIENVIIFVVDINPQPLFDQIKVAVSAKDSKSRPLPGIKAQAMLEHFKDSPGTLLLAAGAADNPVPQGLVQNPYSSMEQMAYNLASELSYAVERGVETGVYKASDSEVNVVLCSRSFSGGSTRFRQALISELQQAMVSMDNMICAVSMDDFGQVFTRIDFYQQHDEIFEMDSEKLKPGSVLLMAETRNYAEKRQVALRAVWRVTPLKDKNGNFIPDNSAGTYVSGFTSKAWFDGKIPSVSTPQYNVPEKKTVKNPDKGFD